MPPTTPLAIAADGPRPPPPDRWGDEAGWGWTTQRHGPGGGGGGGLAVSRPLARAWASTSPHEPSTKGHTIKLRSGNPQHRALSAPHTLGLCAGGRGAGGGGAGARAPTRSSRHVARWSRTYCAVPHMNAVCLPQYFVAPLSTFAAFPEQWNLRPGGWGCPEPARGCGDSFPGSPLQCLSKTKSLGTELEQQSRIKCMRCIESVVNICWISNAKHGDIVFFVLNVEFSPR